MRIESHPAECEGCIFLSKEAAAGRHDFLLWGLHMLTGPSGKPELLNGSPNFKADNHNE